MSELEARASRRGRVDQRSVADVLGKYYGTKTGEHGRYAARYDDAQTETSVLTCPDWLDLACPLFAAHDQLKVTSSARDVFAELDSDAAGRAAQR